jgi:hypothetical protein
MVSAASLVGSDFSCNISLAIGVNLIVVRATDIAGNVAAIPLRLTLAGTLPAPTSLQITPTGVNMLVGQTQQFTAVDEQGRPRNDATWTVSDTSLTTITTDAEPVLTAVAVGQVTLTANVGGISAQMQVNILSGTSLPPGTVRWSAPPIPGFTTVKILQAVPASANTPDLYSVEENANGSRLVRAFTAEGRQMWQKTLDEYGPFADPVPDGFGGLVLRVYANQDGLVDLDGVTGAQVWRHDSPAGLDTRLAIRQDGAVSTVEQGSESLPFIFSSSAAVFDWRSGQPRVRVKIPSSVSRTINCSCNGQVQENVAPSPAGAATVDQDGTVLLEYVVSDETRQCTDCLGGEPFGEQDSFSNALYLLRIASDGSSTTQTLVSSAASRLIVGHAIPDGQGGQLAS